MKIVKFFLDIIAIIIISGLVLGYYYSTLPEHNPQDNKQSCKSVGGEWQDDEMKCLVSYKKAGETCTDGGQCESGVCYSGELTPEQKEIINNETISNIIGICYSDDLIKDCVPQVLMGKITKESMCLEN